MNFCSQVIMQALCHISSSYYGGQPLNIVEVGCMFKEDEALSTYLVADFLAKRPGGGRFVSIEYDLNHIDASKVIIQKRNPYLIGFIEYRLGVPAMNSWNFEVIGSRHRMLAYGSPTFITKAKIFTAGMKVDVKEPGILASALTLASAVKRKSKRFLSRYRPSTQREIQ